MNMSVKLIKIIPVICSMMPGDDAHTTMRLGMVGKDMEEWFRQHPDATYEQGVAAARRFVYAVNSNPSFFKRVRFWNSLMKRTDLQTSLEA